jgi:hypothetical protein
LVAGAEQADRAGSVLSSETAWRLDR